MEEVRFLHTRTYWKKGVEVIDSIMELYGNKLPPFDRYDAVLPQDPAHMPSSLKLGGVAHRMFLFTANYYMRGGIDSNTAFKLLGRLYDLHPEFFSPIYAANRLTEERLQAHLESVGLNYSKSRVPAFWIENARRLLDRYKGDPGLIFQGVATYEEACRRVQNDHRGGGFKGFQKKMVSMLTYFYMDAGFVSPFSFPIPVDIHVARITLTNKIVQVGGIKDGDNVLRLVGGRELVLDAIRDFYLWYSVEQKVDPLSLCNAIWMYSRLRCSSNPENEWERIGNKGENRSRRIRKKSVDWDDPATFERWRLSCGLCPLSRTCRLNGPAMPYYVRGEFGLDDDRTGPPSDIQERIGLLMPVEDIMSFSQDKPMVQSPKKDVARSPDYQLHLGPD